jgi:predicted ArsR family transcriptional regulator
VSAGQEGAGDKSRLSRFDVLALVLARPGITAPEIAASTGVSVKAIDNHLHRLFSAGEVTKTRLPPGRRTRYAYGAKSVSCTSNEQLVSVVMQLEERLAALHEQRRRLNHEITLLEETVERLSSLTGTRAVEPAQCAS